MSPLHSRLVSRATLACALFALLAADAYGQQHSEPDDLFVLLGTNGVTLPPQAAKGLEAVKAISTTSRVQLVRIEGVKELLDDQQVTLNLPFRSADPAQVDRFTVRAAHVEATSEDDFVWNGAVEGVEGGYIVLIYQKGSVTATIKVGEDDVYQVHALGGPLHALVKVDYTDFPSLDVIGSAEGASQPSEAPPGEQNGEYELSPRYSALTAATECSPEIRVLGLYTPNAKAAISNPYGTISLAISEMNSALRNSYSTGSVVLAHTAEYAFGETASDIDGDLYQIRQKTVHSCRGVRPYAPTTTNPAHDPCTILPGKWY